MKRVVLVLAAALIAVPAAQAKFRLRMVLSDGHPTVGQTIRVTVHASPVQPRGTSLRLLAIPPRVGLYRALRVEERYAVPLVREGRGWRASVTFGRPGQWRLVIPNWGAPGYAIPPPLVRVVPVTP